MRERLEKNRAAREAVPEDSVKVDRPGGASSIRALVQLVLVVIGWFLFLWAWVSVMRYTAPETVAVTTILLAAFAVVVEAINLLWIRHNMKIYKKKGPRENVPQVRYEFRRDFSDRRLAADWQSLQGEALIIVSFDDGQKTFTPYRQEPTAEKLASYSRLRDVPTSPEGKEAN